MKLSRCIGVLAVTCAAWFGFSAVAQESSLSAPVQETTRRAPDGVNWITERSDGTSTMTMVHVRPAKPLTDYERGFNDALDCLALLKLEMKLNGQEKTWAEIKSLLRERNKVRARE